MTMGTIDMVCKGCGAKRSKRIHERDLQGWHDRHFAVECVDCANLKTFGRNGFDTDYPVWEGDRRINAAGYAEVYSEGRWASEHRVVMKQVIGRELVKGESVHHINGDRADNRPENLELWVTAPRPGQRSRDVALDYLSRLAPEEVHSLLEEVITKNSLDRLLRLAAS